MPLMKPVAQNNDRPRFRRFAALLSVTKPRAHRNGFVVAHHRADGRVMAQKRRYSFRSQLLAGRTFQYPIAVKRQTKF